MVRRYRSLNEFLLKQAAGRLRRRPEPGGIGIIGGAGGPTAVFISRKQRLRHDNGRLRVTPDAGEVFRSLRLTAVVVFLLASAACALYSILTRRH